MIHAFHGLAIFREREDNPQLMYNIVLCSTADLGPTRPCGRRPRRPLPRRQLRPHPGC
jgi:hypothetical protein